MSYDQVTYHHSSLQVQVACRHGVPSHIQVLCVPVPVFVYDCYSSTALLLYEWDAQAVYLSLPVAALRVRLTAGSGSLSASATASGPLPVPVLALQLCDIWH